jgi:hypothetical protein
MSNKAKQVRAQKGRRPKKHGHFTPEFLASDQLIIYKNPSRNTPFPRRYRTVVKTSMNGFINSGTGAIKYYCKMNSVNLPMAGGGWTNLAPAAATIRPTGLAQVFHASFYNLARVLSSKITVQVSPGDAADAMQVSITPSSSNTLPSSVERAMGQDYTTWKQICIGTPQRSQTVTNEVSQSELLGVREQAIEDDLSGEFICGYNADPVQTLWWVINFEPDNGGVLAAIAAVSVVLEHEVELWGNADANQPEALVLGTPGETPGKCTCCNK